MTQTQYLPLPSMPHAHWLVQAALLPTVCVAVAACELARFAAIVASDGITQPRPLDAYFPAEQLTCLNPYDPGAQPFTQVSKPATQFVALVEPSLAEFGPVQSTSVRSTPAVTLSMSACVSDPL